MTIQEFIISEAEKYVDNSKPVENDECSWQVVDESFSDGLTKGLDIAKEYSVWKENNYVKVWDKYCHRHSDISEKRLHLTNEQLLTIFLTEKYGNNG